MVACSSVGTKTMHSSAVCSFIVGGRRGRHGDGQSIGGRQFFSTGRTGSVGQIMGHFFFVPVFNTEKKKKTQVQYKHNATKLFFEKKVCTLIDLGWTLFGTAFFLLHPLHSTTTPLIFQLPQWKRNRLDATMTILCVLFWKKT